ncbi:MAG: ATP-binding protein [Lentisphaeria bacterium]|nr:ATP-binding protein [Lentisphaeria bacterium]
MSKLYLIMGLPGSGKTTKAEEIRLLAPDRTKHFEADMFFLSEGKYVFDPAGVPYAQWWCQRETENALRERYDVIVSNTFLTPAERRPYILLAKKYACELVVLCCSGNYGSTHGVPPETMEKMKRRFVPFDREKEGF